MRPRPTFAHHLLALVALLILGGPAAAQTSSGDDPTEPFIMVEVLGGLCQYGACYTRLEIEADGSWLLAEGYGDPVSEARGALDADRFEALTALIASADFEALRSRPFAATCPTAADGPQYVYTFALADGLESLDSCVSDLAEMEPTESLRMLLVELYTQSR